LSELPEQAAELSDRSADPVVLVCRSGVRSTTGAAILTGLGFSKVYNLKGGMVAWNAQKLPVQR
jgi:rhodanese-related sulfurtransferase